MQRITEIEEKLKASMDALSERMSADVPGWDERVRPILSACEQTNANVKAGLAADVTPYVEMCRLLLGEIRQLVEKLNTSLTTA